VLGSCLGSYLGFFLLTLSPPTLPDPPSAAVPEVPAPGPAVPEIPSEPEASAPADSLPPPIPAPEPVAPEPVAPEPVAPEPAVAPLPPPDPLPSPEDFELPTPASPRRFQPPPPRYRGTGMLVASGIVGAGALGLKLWSTALVYQSLDDGWFGGAEAAVYPSLFYNPLFGISLGLLGGGMGMRGQWRAHVDTFGGDAPERRFWVRPALGWSLFGAGVGSWALTRVIGWLAPNMNAVQRAAFLELTYYGSLGLSTSGMALGAFGSGYRRMERLFGTPVAIAPSLGRDHAGLSISGRF
jgi:hypothetical protein